MTMPETETADVNKVTSSLVEEVFNAMGLSKTGIACRTFGWTVKPIAHRLAVLTVPCDYDLKQLWVTGGGTEFPPPFCQRCEIARCRDHST